MIEQLTATRRALEDALESYLQAFQTVRQLYVDGQPVNTIHPDLTAALVEHFSVIDSFKETLDITKRAVGRSMNASSALTPIHGLPQEILTSIFFKFATDNGPDVYSTDTWHQKSLRNITSVCSYWRQVALNSAALWTQIDFVVKSPTDHAAKNPFLSHLELAKVYEQRAAKMSLHIRIIDPNRHASLASSCNLLATFVASIAPRVRSFRLFVDETRAYHPVLSTLFNNCTPGCFTSLAMYSNSCDTYHFDTETQPSFIANTLLVDVSKKRLDEVYAGITALELCMIYPKWDSSAYDGLTELRLDYPRRGSTHITEFQLVEVLRHSPRLRVLECGVNLKHCLEGDCLVDLIPLDELEVLSLSLRRDKSTPQTILRWLAPGSKPLKLLINEVDLYGPFCESFLSRSNTTQLYLQEASLSNTSIMHFMNYLPNLHTMVLRRECRVREHTHPDCHFSENLPSSLETIYVIGHDFNFGLGPLPQFSSIKTLRRIIFSCCLFRSPEKFLSELSLLNPGVELKINYGNELELELDLLRRWEIFSQS